MNDLFEPNASLRLWTFFDGNDPTGGQVNYLSRADAEAEGLAYVQTDGKTVLRVDSLKDLPNGVRRDSCVVFAVVARDQGHHYFLVSVSTPRRSSSTVL